MFDIWFELPPILRAIMGLGMIGVAVAIWYATGGHLYVYGLGVVGLMFLLFSGAGNTGGGYKF